MAKTSTEPGGTLVRMAHLAKLRGVARSTVLLWRRQGHLVMRNNLVDLEASCRNLDARVPVYRGGVAKPAPATEAVPTRRYVIDLVASAAQLPPDLPEPFERLATDEEWDCVLLATAITRLRSIGITRCDEDELVQVFDAICVEWAGDA